MNYTNEQMEYALTLVDRWLLNLIGFYLFGLSIISTGFAIIIAEYTPYNYLMVLPTIFIILNMISIYSLLMIASDSISRLFSKRDKMRRAYEVLEKLNEDPTYFDKGLLGDWIKGVKQILIKVFK